MSILNKAKSLLKKSEKEAKVVASKATKAADLNKDGKVNTKDAKVAKDRVVKTASKTTKGVKKAVKKK